MIKKIILGVVVLGISTGLIYGGVNRTIARADTGEQENQSEKNLSLNVKRNLEERNLSPIQEGSGKRSQGQGNGRINDISGQQGGGNKSESDNDNSGEELKDNISFSGIISQADGELLVILSEKGGEVVIEGRSWRFVIDAGFPAEIGDSITLNGFYETADEFEVSTIENLTKNVEIQIREGNGRPLWAGNGRSA